VLNHVSKSTGNTIGLGATTVIIEGGNDGLKLVGPLPIEIQNYTIYAAAVVTGGAATEPAQEFVRFLATPAARQIFSIAGIE
jgi:molybdate transport system substrate-binding protein